MILQALSQYYERKSSEQNTQIAPFGFEWKEIPFILELDTNGNLIQIEDTREGSGKKKIARAFLVPQGVKKAAGIISNLLWDNVEYVLGINTQDDPKREKRVEQQHAAFVEKIIHFAKLLEAEPGIQAIVAFLKNFDLSSIKSMSIWEDIKNSNSPNMTFRLNGKQELICQHKQIIQELQNNIINTDNLSFCLLSGKNDEIERLHTAIKGVWGAQTSGANIVSFNLEAFNSFGKAQSYNAPIGKKSVFAYTTALNFLLRKESPQRVQVGDTSTVFWAEKPSNLETMIPDIFDEPPKDDPDRNTNAVKALYNSISHGLPNEDDNSTKFYVLGLAPNAARIAIRFFHVCTITALAKRLVMHFNDINIVHSSRELPHLPLFRLLVSIATQGKAANIPPNMGGEIMRSILDGTPYPQTLLAAAIRRIRAEHKIDYPRAAIIKACLNRSSRYTKSQKEEIKVSLDEDNTNPGYRLGRLFATLEKIQEEANPGINSTIRDRYYGSASSTPVTVFSTLLKLKNHHLSKLENRGRAVNFEKLLGQILESIDNFPANLSLPDQGYFAIGYYHQRHNFFNTQDKK